MSGNDSTNPYAPPPGDPKDGGGKEPQFGQRSDSWSPNPGPDTGPESPWPVYGQNYGAPSQGALPQSQQTAWPLGQQVPIQSPFPGAGMVPAGPPPSRGGAIALLVSGIVTMVLVAPILFVTLVLSSIGMDRIVEIGMATQNNGQVAVGSTGILSVTPLDGDADSCQLVAPNGEVIPMTYEIDSGGMFVARGLTEDVYTVECEGIPPGASVMAVDGEFMSDMVGGTMAAFGWSTLVGLIGLGMLIAGIIWLVKRNRARRAFYQGLPY